MDNLWGKAIWQRWSPVVFHDLHLFFTMIAHVHHKAQGKAEKHHTVGRWHDVLQGRLLQKAALRDNAEGVHCGQYLLVNLPVKHFSVQSSCKTDAHYEKAHSSFYQTR